MHKDGREIPVEISLSPVHTDHGHFVSRVIRDVTVRRRMQREIISARQAQHKGLVFSSTASRPSKAYVIYMPHRFRLSSSVTTRRKSSRTRVCWTTAR